MQPSSTLIGAAPITLRRARPDELHGLRALLAAAFVQYDVDLSAELFARYVADLCETATDVEHTIVAETGGRIVGSVRMLPPPTPGGRAGMRALAVLPHERGAGVGRLLVERVLHDAAAAGASELLLHTAAFMRSAVRLYERLGFRRAPELDLDAGDFHPGHPISDDLRVLAYVVGLHHPTTITEKEPLR